MRRRRRGREESVLDTKASQAPGQTGGIRRRQGLPVPEQSLRPLCQHRSRG